MSHLVTLWPAVLVPLLRETLEDGTTGERERERVWLVRSQSIVDPCCVLFSLRHQNEIALLDVICSLIHLSAARFAK